MAIQLPPSALINPNAPPIQDMIDAVENLASDYVMTWGKLPRYLYVNDRLWADTMIGLLRTVELYGLEVVTHPEMPYEMAALHWDYLPPRDVALREKAKMTDIEEAIDRGQVMLG